MNKRLILEYLIANGGLKEGETWAEVAKRFNVSPPNKERAEKDSAYASKAPARAVNDIWRAYNSRKMKPYKATYVDGELKYETYKVVNSEQAEVDLENFEIVKVTTNPSGNPWIQYKKKETVYSEDHFKSLRELLRQDLLPVEYNIPEIKNNSSMLLYFSDRHIGALTKEDSIYTNKYHKDEILLRNVGLPLSIVSKHQKMKKLFIMDLGDALDGFNGKTTNGLKGISSHTLPQQLNNREQFDLYVEVNKRFFDRLVALEPAEEIYFIATSNSNHGGDFDYMAMKTVEMYLNNKYPFIKTYVTEKFLDHFIFDGNAIIFSHGKDSEDRKRGLPLTLDPKTEVFISDYIQENNLSKYNITFVSGDLHQAAETFGKNFRYRKVLSQYGGSKWIHSNFGTNKPGISYDIIENREIQTINNYYDVGTSKNTGIKF